MNRYACITFVWALAIVGCGGGDAGSSSVDSRTIDVVDGGLGGADGAGEPPPSDAACPADTACTRCSSGCGTDDFCADGWCVPTAQGGRLGWVVRASTSGLDWAMDVAVTGDGAAVVVGSIYEGAGVIGPSSILQTTLHDAIAVRVDSAGGIDWARRVAIGPAAEGARAVVVLPGGDYVIAGTLEGEATFAPGMPGETTLSGAGFLARFDPTGDLVWGKAVDFFIADLTVMPDGTLVLSGQAPGLAGVVAYYDGDDGSFLRERRFSSTGGCFTGGVAAKADGSFAVAGTFAGTLTLSPSISFTAFAGGDGFVARVAADGTLLWARQLEGAGSDVYGSVAIGPDDSVYAAGVFEGYLYMGVGEPHETMITSLGGWDVVLARYASDGTLDWVVTGGGVGAEDAPALALYPDGSAVIASLYTPPSGAILTAPYTMTIAPGTPREQVLDGSLLGGGYAARYQPDGTLAWVRNYHGAGDGLSGFGIRGVAVGPDHKATVVGQFGADIVFGRGEPSETTLWGDADIAVLRLGL